MRCMYIVYILPSTQSVSSIDRETAIFLSMIFLCLSFLLFSCSSCKTNASTMKAITTCSTTCVERGEGGRGVCEGVEEEGVSE